MQHLIKTILENKENAGQTITLTRIVYESLKEEGIPEFLEEYKTNVNFLKEELKSVMVLKEKYVVGTPGSLNMGLQKRSLPKAKITDTVSNVLKSSEKLSKDKYGPESSVDFRTFLYTTINYLNSESGDTDLLICLQDAGFDFDSFVNDFQNGKKEKRSLIEELCTNFNELAKKGKIDPVIGRNDEILRTIEILSKRKKNNVVLLGKAGVGKTAIAEGLALAIVEKNVPPQLKDAVIFNLEMANMVAGTQFRGQFEEKLMNLLKEFKQLEAQNKFPILFIDEIHTIMGSGSGGGGSLDFANIVKPALSRGELRCVGATTESEWNQHINHDKALKRRFAQVFVEEPTRNQTIDILKGAKKYYEEKHEVVYSDDSIARTVDLSIEFMNDTALPDKALDLFDLSGAIYKLKGQKNIGIDEVENSICRLKSLSLDVVRLKKSNTEIQPMSPKIKENLFGQDHAVEQIVKVVERSIAGLQEDNKPIGQFLLVGPTGVGKTELAKLIAKEMKCPLERIDMSEYMEAHSVSKLIGAPPGYVGYDSGGRLSKAVSKNPRLVLLLDEIEKAHPKVLEILLQAMDNAKITDSQGDEVKFNNVLILMTSNAGATELSERSIGISEVPLVEKKINTRAIENSFLPEFRNRLSGIVYFNSLPKDKMVYIVKKFVKSLNETKLLNRGIKVTLTPDAELWIVNKTFDPNMGGRPIERGVQTYVSEEVTQSILYGEIKNGKKNVEVSVENDSLKFTYK